MRVVIAEDSALMREGLTALVERFGHEVAAAVADADELLRVIDALVPDVVITDVRMPPDNTDDGFRAALAIRARHPEIGILVLSQYLGDSYATRLLQTGSDAAGSPQAAGARSAEVERAGSATRPHQRAGSAMTVGGVGYLLKDRVGRVADFMHSLELVASGGVVIDPKVIQRSIDAGRPNALANLSDREREVLARMAAGDTNQQIAETLRVSDGAVVKHIGNIFTKLGVQPEDGNRRVLAVLTYLRSTTSDPA